MSDTNPVSVNVHIQVMMTEVVVFLHPLRMSTVRECNKRVLVLEALLQKIPLKHQ